jgi:hypothetical protein
MNYRGRASSQGARRIDGILAENRGDESLIRE